MSSLFRKALLYLGLGPDEEYDGYGHEGSLLFESGPASRPEAGMTVTCVGGPRDGECSRPAHGVPPAVLIVDDSGGRYEWRAGHYWWRRVRGGP
jgi:hypothetical protein